MKSLYKHILFDLDHTLWDFEKNSEEALFELYDRYEFKRLGTFTNLKFATAFKEINASLWEQYNRNEIGKEFLRTARFSMALNTLGVNKKDIPHDIGEVYLELCPVKGHVIPYAFEILEYLQPRYSLHIITNGFDDVQDIKLTRSKLKDYFEYVITSEKVGFKKPSREMFEKAVALLGADKKECIMVGDNPETDIQGAINAQLDVIYFNPEKVLHKLPVTHEIQCLSELKHIL